MKSQKWSEKKEKAVNFGMLYNMDPSHLVKDGVSKIKDDGKRFINAFLRH